MKKFLILTCMIACILGMTACGGQQDLTLHEQQTLQNAQAKAKGSYIPVIQMMLGYGNVTREQLDLYMQQGFGVGLDELDNCTAEEVEYIVYQLTGGLQVDGNAFRSAMDSFESAYEEIGGPGEITGSTAVIDDDQVIVTVDVKGTTNNAQAEIVLTNDIFLNLESASLNKVSTMGDSMGKAAMNTLLGMGSVFIVLILISLIISCFSLIPKIQNAFAKKPEETTAAVGIDNALAQIAQQEEESVDDLELVAVIAAAIAASEGAASTDGFVVRSIRRRKAF